MNSLTESTLTIDQLKELANAPELTTAQLISVLCSLAGDEDVCQWASETLENCGTPAQDATLSIAQFVAHGDELIASWSCKLLARQGQDGTASEHELTRALALRSEVLVREEAARALGQIGFVSSEARAALLAAAQNGWPRLKRLATASLGG